MPYTIPPSSPDYISDIAARILSIILANSFITGSLRVKQNNVVTNLSGKPDQRKLAAQQADRPYIIIETTQERIANRNAMPTFSNTKSAIGDVLINKDLTYQITVEWDSLDRNQPNQFRTVSEALLLADPTLGYGSTGPIYVRTSGGYSASTVEQKSVAAVNQQSGNSRLVLVQKLSFPVTIQLSRATLIANAAYVGT